MIKNTTTKSRRPSAAIVISCLALFLALTGSAFAAKSLVRSGNIVNGTIRTVDLHNNAVRSPKIADATITADDLATDSVGTDEIQANAVTDSEIAPAAVTATKIAPNAVDSARLDSVFQRSSASQAIAAGATGTVSVTCPAGEQILSGGGQPANFGVEMTSSRPSGNGWLYQAKNQNGVASTITAYALCLAS